MNERDELMAQLRELRAQAEEITERTSKIITEEERRRHRWTPVVIRGGLAGAAVAWLVGLVRGAHPIAAATTTIGASGAIVGAVLVPPTITPPEAEHRPPAVERTAPTPVAPTRPAVEPTVEPVVEPHPARAVKAPPAPSTARPSTAQAPTAPPQPAAPPARREPQPPSTDDTCVVDLDALDLVDLCLTTRRRAEDLDGPGIERAGALR